MSSQTSTLVPKPDTSYSSGHPAMMPPPPTYHAGTRPHPPRTLSIESISSYSDMEELSRSNVSQQRSHRPRRRHAPSLEDVKHRRTRSGCYTCRQRRVKCDESHPVCDRCRKGKRECTYPESSSTLKKSRSTVKVKALPVDSGSNVSDDEIDVNSKDMLPTDFDDDLNRDERELKTVTTDIVIRDDSILDEESVTSPLDDFVDLSPEFHYHGIPPSQPNYTDQPPTPSASSNARWFSLPEDVKLLLLYYRDRLSHHHYAIRNDPEDFFKTQLLEIALNDTTGALLYAVVAFAAYHRTFALEYSGITNFLSYYNKAIILLKQSLNNEPTTTTLFTILQLGTIEEFLGDWSTLMGHQKAAYQIITSLFTPKTIAQDAAHRQILRWYIRLELFAATMSTSEVTLGREWFETSQEYYGQKARENPLDVPSKLEEYFSMNRLLAVDSMVLVSQRSKNEIDDEEFSRRCTQLVARFKAFSQAIESTANASFDLATTDTRRTSSSGVDLPNSQQASLLRREDPFAMKVLLLDARTVQLMIKHQILPPNPAELTTIALKMFGQIEEMECSDQGRAGGIIACQSGIGIAALFLPKDQKHIDWARRKFAVIERMGYIYPAAFRERMSAMWGVDVRQSWLPDHENNPAALRNLREFIDYRRGVPANSFDPELRHMRGIFRSLFADASSTNGT